MTEILNLLIKGQATLNVKPTGNNEVQQVSFLVPQEVLVNFPEIQPVSFPTPVPVTGSFYPNVQPVSGEFYPGVQPVSGNFYPDVQPVSGNFYPQTQPVSGNFYPAVQPVSFTPAIPKASGAAITVSPTITTASVKIIDVNANRTGLILYNNSANSVYLSYVSPANSANNMTFILATFASLVLPQPIYTGAIYGIRNAGTGTVIATELTA